MSIGKPQAVSGVSAGTEAALMVKYPSIACRGIGRAMGSLCDSIPAPKINGIKPSYLLFGWLAAPFGLVGYFEIKITGNKYVLTNRSVQIWKALGSRLVAQVLLTDIDQIEIRQQPGQAFYKAADLYLLDSSGETSMRLEAVTRPDVFRETILKARDARREVEASLATIEARQSA